MASVVILAGGGLKSAAILAATAPEHRSFLVHIDAGQTTSGREALAARTLASAYPPARLVRLDLPLCRQLSGATATTKTHTPDLAPAILPAKARQGLLNTMLSIGVQCALRFRASRVLVGLSKRCTSPSVGYSGPQAGQDRLRELIHALNIATECIAEGGQSVSVEAPLMDLSHTDIVRLCLRLGVPLDQTWTCVERDDRPCGVCDPCRTRGRAFHEAGEPDPLIATGLATEAAPVSSMGRRPT